MERPKRPSPRPPPTGYHPSFPELTPPRFDLVLWPSSLIDPMSDPFYIPRSKPKVK